MPSFVFGYVGVGGVVFYRRWTRMDSDFVEGSLIAAEMRYVPFCHRRCFDFWALFSSRWGSCNAVCCELQPYIREGDGFRARVRRWARDRFR